MQREGHVARLVVAGPLKSTVRLVVLQVKEHNMHDNDSSVPHERLGDWIVPCLIRLLMYIPGYDEEHSRTSSQHACLFEPLNTVAAHRNSPQCMH